MKLCNCICFIHNGENQGHNPTPITEKSVPTTKANNIQAKNTLKDPSIPSRATKNSQPLPNKSSIAKPTTSVTPVTLLIKPKFTCAEEALYSARNNILEAYRLTSDRDSQKQLLDFLNLFMLKIISLQGTLKHYLHTNIHGTSMRNVHPPLNKRHLLMDIPYTYYNCKISRCLCIYVCIYKAQSHLRRMNAIVRIISGSLFKNPSSLLNHLLQLLFSLLIITTLKLF